MGIATPIGRGTEPSVPRKKDKTDSRHASKDYRFMTALARGLSVLRAFGPDNRPLGNAEIAERVGLPKPTVSRITFTLSELGTYGQSIGPYWYGDAFGYGETASLIQLSYSPDPIDMAIGWIVGDIDRRDLH